MLAMRHGVRTQAATIGNVSPYLPVLVFTGSRNAEAISIALDAGAEGVLVPMTETIAGCDAVDRIAALPGLDLQ